eukprot:TRINITY_DN45117_c0_g1_i1.p1 TRINITY_DN45117_c0_g1~~TRINITY_DN45117_c0_g1_i1.p1  ORF type:complete len:552 (-),score=86.68 TRINITY_DN45117_c0_g1_i1:379-1950(-)
MASDDWDKAKVRQFVADGQPIEGMKLVMRELRAFAERHNVTALPIDTAKFYSEPSAFGTAFKVIGGDPKAVERFAEVLAERGIIFVTLEQPARGLQDLEAAVEMSDKHDAHVMETFGRAKAEVHAALQVEKKKEEARKIPVIVLTGFLGAGKTTLLNYILRVQHGLKYAVIENEIGQVGIDNKLLIDEGMKTKTEESITLLDNGCLCCTVRDDLIGAVRQIVARADLAEANRAAADQATTAAEADKPPLDGIIIETTGLADPGPVCKTFYAEEDLRRRARIDGVVTVVDAAHFSMQLNRKRSDGAVNESAQQVAFADKILLNKVDAVTPDALQSIEKEIGQINGMCPIIRCSLKSNPEGIPLNELLASQSFSLDRVIADLGNDTASQRQDPPAAKRQRSGAGVSLRESFRGASRHDSGVSTCFIHVTGAPLELEKFMHVMNTLRAEKAMDLYRYKGFVCIKEPSGTLKRAVLQGVHDMAMMEPRGVWPADAPFESQLVFIGRNLDKELWTSLFEKTKEGVLGK